MLECESNVMSIELKRVYEMPLALFLALAGRTEAQQPLVTPAEVARIGGMKGIIPTPKDMEMEESQSFMREADSAIVLIVGLPKPSSAADFAAARTALAPHENVPGVGDDAFSIGGGSMLLLRKGNRQVQITTGYDVAKRGAPVFAPPSWSR